MEVYERFGIKKEEWDAQKALFDHYIAHQAAYVRLYNGKHLVFHEMQVKGAFDTRVEAHNFAIGHFEPGTFIIQRCSPGDGDYRIRIPYRQRI